MNTDTVYAYAIDLIMLEAHPSVLEKSLRPASALRTAWVPQTIADEVWIFYSFSTAQQKDDFARTFIPSKHVRVLQLTPDEILHWIS